MAQRSNPLRKLVVPVITIGALLFGGSVVGATSSEAAPILSGDRVSQATSGGGHMAAEAFTLHIDPDGHLWGFGDNSVGELGDGTKTRRLTPTIITPERTYIAVAAGDRHTLALDSGGRLYAWGKGDIGQTTVGTVSVPTAVAPTSRRYTAIEASIDASFAIDTAGNLWSWGTGVVGQGAGWGVNTVMKQVMPGVKFAQVSAGINHVSALTTAGDIWAWGDNTFGKLGLGYAGTNADVPKAVPAATKYKAISLGTDHSVALDMDGNLWTWGAAHDATSHTPRKVETGVTYKSVAASYLRTTAVDVTGTLWTAGTLADGTIAKAFQKVLPDVSFESVVAHDDNYLAIGESNRLWAWGSNLAGQNGQGTLGGSAVEPQLVEARRFAVNLLTNPSLETSSSAFQVLRTNLVKDPGGYSAATANWSVYAGQVAIAQSMSAPLSATHVNGAASGNGWFHAVADLKPNTRYRVSAAFKESGGPAPEGLSMSVANIAPTWFWPDTVNGTNPRTAQLTRAADGVWSGQLSFTTDSRALPKGGIIFDFKGAGKGEKITVARPLLVEETSQTTNLTGNGFDGSSVGNAANKYAWLGAAYNSASTHSTLAPAGFMNTYSRANVTVSTDWAASGSSSARITPTQYFYPETAGNLGADSFISYDPLSSDFAGKTVRALGTMMLKEPQRGNLDYRARLSLIYATANASSPASTNAAGVYQHEATVSIPATTTSDAMFRWYDGAPKGDGEVWWDNLAIIEGNYTGGYFDGATNGGRWWGAAHASVSLKDLDHHPGISLTKTQNGLTSLTQEGAPTYAAGSSVDWGYNVKNTGDVTLTNPVLVDSTGLPITCPGTSIRPGETLRCTSTGVIGNGSYGN